MVVESISIQSSGVLRLANAVPRRSVIAWMGSPAASRCAISTICRSALPIDKQVRLGIEQDRAADLLRPVVEVRDAPQAGLDAADDEGHVGERLAHPLRIDDHRRSGRFAADAPGV
jgi:hypothetical protein